jgi:hypothetical protein
MNDRKELEALRLSVARIAQVLGVKDEVLLTDPMTSCRTKERGWNTLAGDCVTRAQALTQELAEVRDDAEQSGIEQRELMDRLADRDD